MGYSVHDVLGKVVAYYIKKHKNLKNQFLVMIWNFYHFKRQNFEFTKNQHNFKILYLFKNYKLKSMSCIWTIISIYCNNLQKQLLKNSFVWKSYFGRKIYMWSYFKIMLLARLISFTPLCNVLSIALIVFPIPSLLIPHIFLMCFATSVWTTFGTNDQIAM
jgi:hypothetical protein